MKFNSVGARGLLGLRLKHLAWLVGLETVHAEVLATFVIRAVVILGLPSTPRCLVLLEAVRASQAGRASLVFDWVVDYGVFLFVHEGAHNRNESRLSRALNDDTSFAEVVIFAESAGGSVEARVVSSTLASFRGNSVRADPDARDMVSAHQVSSGANDWGKGLSSDKVVIPSNQVILEASILLKSLIPFVFVLLMTRAFTTLREAEGRSKAERPHEGSGESEQRN
jgi:hypothetical protein